MDSIDLLGLDNFFEIQTCNKLRPNVFHIVTNDKCEFILKTKKIKRETSKKGLNIAGLYYYMNMAFKWEMYVNRELSANCFKSFRFPKLMYTDNSTYMVLEHVKGEIIETPKISAEAIVKAVIELEKSEIRDGNWIQRGILKPLRSVSVSLLRGIVFILPRELGLSKMYQAMSVFYRMGKQQKKHPKGGWLHKDLKHDGNYLYSEDRNFYIIDFEMAVKEKKWLMVDIIDLAWNPESLNLDYRLVAEYEKRMANENDWPINIFAQTRVALLRKAIFYTRREKYDTEERGRIREFISEILLDDASYTKWIDDQRIKNG